MSKPRTKRDQKTLQQVAADLDPGFAPKLDDTVARFLEDLLALTEPLSTKLDDVEVISAAQMMIAMLSKDPVVAIRSLARTIRDLTVAVSKGRPDMAPAMEAALRDEAALLTPAAPEKGTVIS